MTAEKFSETEEGKSILYELKKDYNNSIGYDFPWGLAERVLNLGWQKAKESNKCEKCKNIVATICLPCKLKDQWKARQEALDERIEILKKKISGLMPLQGCRAIEEHKIRKQVWQNEINELERTRDEK